MAPMPATISAKDDDKLRRFAAIGWVLREAADGRGNKTRHVLVVDMDDKKFEIANDGLFSPRNSPLTVTKHQK
ncbi:MAG: hypothetical protein Q9166_008210, partial [cf. Caloplaca sp. 2 TL-2023]